MGLGDIARPGMAGERGAVKEAIGMAGPSADRKWLESRGLNLVGEPQALTKKLEYGDLDTIIGMEQQRASQQFKIKLHKGQVIHDEKGNPMGLPVLGLGLTSYEQAAELAKKNGGIDPRSGKLFEGRVEINKHLHGATSAMDGKRVSGREQGAVPSRPEIKDDLSEYSEIYQKVDKQGRIAGEE